MEGRGRIVLAHPAERRVPTPDVDPSRVIHLRRRPLWRIPAVSLKAFHIVFVLVSTILTFGFGIWAVRDYRAAGDVSSLAFGIISLALGAALLIYGRWFLSKLRDVSYL